MKQIHRYILLVMSTLVLLPIYSKNSNCSFRCTNKGKSIYIGKF